MSKRQEVRERHRKQKQQRRMMTIGAIIIGAGLITAALIMGQPPTSNDYRSREMAQGNTMGDPEAPIKIVEYADYKCGHCADFALETEPLLEEEYVNTGIVHFTYRSVGEMLSGAQPRLAAEASYCAGDQNKFFELHDLIYANQPLTFNKVQLEKWAKTAGVKDMDQYKACMDNGTYYDRAIQDEIDAKAEGISGTPAFIITYILDGEEVKQLLPGNYPFASFEQIITDGLQAMGLN
ncbi:MAG: thioredoxin domain-containing protein [Anaerolineales bacterium]|uniref:Thioredoxin domain-containing protein n=1 Tax=Candidatus Desulfolinea nitratireducens TaxID=2841698 RepID=A0A8J6NNY2_9CHLR|nr:thioredoxin domain-containing protein [Candidatus Desulfolinea nitratireducens]MBL6961381.1 thioredoxin domain-containing protein [Anaerolineales bacterium]